MGSQSRNKRDRDDSLVKMNKEVMGRLSEKLAAYPGHPNLKKELLSIWLSVAEPYFPRLQEKLAKTS